MTARGEAGRRYRAKNREAIKRRQAIDKQRRADRMRTDPEFRERELEKKRRHGRESREAAKRQRPAKVPDPEARERAREKAREYGRRYRAAKAADPEFRERAREYCRRYRQEGRQTSASQRAHGANYAEIVTQMLEQQGGRCYLCGENLAPEQAVIDHDHRCCPPRKSCSACRRGLACPRCNRLIGTVEDDPDLLRLIAGNLEAAVRAAEVRIASRPAQLAMYSEDPPEPERTGPLCPP